MGVVSVRDVTVNRSPYSGAYILSAIVDGHRMERVYMGYRKRDAVALFREEAAHGRR